MRANSVSGALLVLAFVVGSLFTSTGEANAADCSQVAELTIQLEQHIRTGWAEKNAGGQEELARSEAREAVNLVDELHSAHFSACMNEAGKIRLLALLSKANLLLAVLAQDRNTISDHVRVAGGIVATMRMVRTKYPAYFRSVSEDLVKTQTRYRTVAANDAAQARARHEASLRIVHPRTSASDARSISSMDAPRPSRNARSSNIASCPVARTSPCNAPARTIRSVEPDTPAVAQQQNISGTVQVIVSLDQDSNVVGVRISSSPSAILNDAALAAARQSVFKTEVRNCKPVAADYIFSVEFSSM
ncbi:MAG TPA: energy transducer TonB [Candidatus Elarobacter sp.]|jgi:TonB family protein|nr:energy transducer TonB [Candidatus Elarobacter sp.]